MEHAITERGAQLKAHKSLPRRRAASEHLEEVKCSGDSPRRTSESQKEVVASWVQQASPTNSDPNCRLPLTPPVLPQDAVESEHTEPSSSQNRNKMASRSVEQSSTPVNHHTPPTPELTPPRLKKSRGPITPPPALRFPSSTSAAESFKTAKEYAVSDDDTNRASSPESDPSTVRVGYAPSAVIPTNATNVFGNVGLGLDIDMGEESLTPVVDISQHVRSLGMQEPATDADLSAVVEDPLIVSEPAAVQEAAVCGGSHELVGSDEIRTDPMRTRDSFSASVDKALLLQQRIVTSRLQAHRNSVRRDSSPAEENSRDDFATELRAAFEDRSEITEHGTQLDLPSSNKQVENEAVADGQMERNSGTSSANSILFDGKRLSELSGASSTVVEAIVIEAPRRRRQKLRHCSKNSSLRDATSPASGSNRSSMASSEARPQLHHKSGIISNSKNRASLNSDSGISMGFDNSSIKENSIPLSEIPKRRSSLKSSKRRNEQGRLDKNPEDSRPMTSPGELATKDEKTNPRQRSVSDLGQRGQIDNRGRDVRRTGPQIPPRTSSLSAPTSRDPSRTASLSSTTRQQKEDLKESIQNRPSGPAVPEITIDYDRKSLGAQSREIKSRKSLTRTPFSAASLQSVTPGPVEVNEATAVNIYPHNNKSLLVVQHSNRPGSQESHDSTLSSNNIGSHVLATGKQPFSLGQSIRETQQKSDFSSDATLSTLPGGVYDAKNAISSGASVNVSHQSKPPVSASMIALKRALSARRYSEPQITPLSRLTPTKPDVPLRRRIKIDDASNTLAPFWRPERFWNDLSDSEDEQEEEHGAEQIHAQNSEVYVRNTLGMPQKRVIPGPVALARRLGSLKKRKEAAQPPNHGLTLRRASMPILGRGELTGFIGGGSRSGLLTKFRRPPDSHLSLGASEAVTSKRHQGRGVSAEELSTSFVAKVKRSFDFEPFTSIHDEIADRRTRRAEAKAERERQRLKNSIGPMILRSSARSFY